MVAYLRVSTAEQGDSRLGLEAQRAKIEQECKRRGWTLLEVYVDVASGKTTNGRPELAKALAEVQAHRADGLVVAKLDRLSRSVHDFSGLLEDAKKQGWALIVLDPDLDSSSPFGKAMANWLATFAELERELIGQRTKEAMAVAKQRGPQPGKLPIGRPRKQPTELERRVVVLREQGFSYQAIADRLNADGVAPARAQRWNWSTVRRIVERLASE